MTSADCDARPVVYASLGTSSKNDLGIFQLNVPLFDYVKDCNQLTRWAAAKGEAGLEDYRRRKNASSLDGLSTGMFEEKNSNS